VSERLASERPLAGDGPRLDGSLARWLTPTSESRIERIACDQVHDRPWWRDEPLTEVEHVALRTSIATRGIVEPLLLRHRGRGGLEVVTGARRLLVARELGMARVPAIVRDLSDREAILVGAWSTVDRRHPMLGEVEGVAAMLVEAGLTEEEVRALAGARPTPSRERVAAAPTARVAPFLFRPMVRGHRGAAAFAPFLRVSVGVMPELPAEEAASALAVLDTVRPASIAS
jgi:ParB-like chromosome segregation protein Spo0J